MPLALTGRQLKTVMMAAGILEPEKRAIFLKRIDAILKLKSRFTDADVADIARLALTGLAHQPAA
jgi:hypothetical protein